MSVACHRTIVHHTCFCGPLSLQLTDLESELNALDSSGFSVLHYACLHGLGALVPVLLQRGADVNLRTGDGHKQVRVWILGMPPRLHLVDTMRPHLGKS